MRMWEDRPSLCAICHLGAATRKQMCARCYQYTRRNGMPPTVQMVRHWWDKTSQKEKETY